MSLWGKPIARSNTPSAIGRSLRRNCYTAIEGGHFACLTNPDGFLDALDADMRRIGIR
jgi:hypothetical protein